MSGAFLNVSPVWNACGEPMSPRVAGSSVNPAVAVVVQAPAARAAEAISQFCDSQASKSVNSRRW